MTQEQNPMYARAYCLLRDIACHTGDDDHPAAGALTAAQYQLGLQSKDQLTPAEFDAVFTKVLELLDAQAKA